MIKYDKNQSKYFDGIIIYFCWNIRKEQNRSTFKQNKFAAKKSHNACYFCFLELSFQLLVDHGLSPIAFFFSCLEFFRVMLSCVL